MPGLFSSAIPRPLDGDRKSPLVDADGSLELRPIRRQILIHPVVQDDGKSKDGFSTVGGLKPAFIEYGDHIPGDFRGIVYIGVALPS